MSESLLLQMKNKLGGMSKSDKAIAAFILENYEKAAYMTAAAIGRQAGVCEATVVRFVRKLGFDGYPQFKRALQETIRNSLTSMQRIELTSARLGDGDILTGVLSNDTDLLRRTMEMADHEQFRLAVDAICGARGIYVVGTRSAAPLASFISYYLSMLFEFVTVIDPSNESELFEQMLHISGEDVCIGISFPRYSKKAVKAMRFASDSGARCIAVTDSSESPLAQFADFLLLAQTDMASIVDSLVAPFSLVNALLAATANRRQNELIERFQRLERLWDEYDVYEKTDVYLPGSASGTGSGGSQ